MLLTSMKHLNSLRVAFTLLALATTASSGQAQIAIYDYRGSVTSLGGGGSLLITGAGGLALDLNTYEATYIGLLAFGTGGNRVQYFQEAPLLNFITTQISGPRGTSYTVLAKAESPSTELASLILQQSSAVGLNSIVTIRTLPSALRWIVPRTLKSIGLGISEEGGTDYLARENGTYTLNAKATTAYNNAGLGVGDFVTSIRNYYTQRGVQEWISPPAN